MNFTREKKVYIETFNQEIISAVMENYESENRKNVKSSNSSLTISNYQNSTTSNKINAVKPE